tara:strand:+ start:651 stop:887 length:237 start_codon:yes stop_codon:yes gene_type:complete
MYNIIKTFRFALILSFVLGMIYLFAKFLLIPILIFALLIKLLGHFKFKKVKKDNSSDQSDNNGNNKSKIIDAEYEELD